MVSTIGVPLAAAQIGMDFRIRAVAVPDDGHTQRLRELGLIEGRTVRLVSNHDPLICQVGDCRFGMCRRLARCVLVEPASASITL